MQEKPNPNDFRFLKFLKRDNEKNAIYLLGTLDNSEKKAILILTKKLFQDDEEKLKALPSNFQSINQYFENDIFSRYTITTKGEISEVDAQIIFPATEKLINKYTKKDTSLLLETASFYEKYTYPALVKGAEAHNQWIYNILEKKAETEKIVFDDQDPQNGFILLPDFENQGDLEKLHLLAIVYDRNLKSLRDLTAAHLPLLLNIYKKSRECIKQKFGLDPSKIKAYVHYQPTYHHFHVHFNHLNITAKTLQFEKARNLVEIIQNIKMKSNYYQEVTLEYEIETQHPLYQQYLKEVSQNVIESEGRCFQDGQI